MCATTILHKRYKKSHPSQHLAGGRWLFCTEWTLYVAMTTVEYVFTCYITTLSENH